MNRTQVAKVWITDSAVGVELKDGRRAEEQFTDYTRLNRATRAQRENYVLSHFGIHWPEIDEDLSYEGFFHGAQESVKA